MKSETNNTISQNAVSKEGHNAKRFKKAEKNKNLSRLSCIDTEDGLNIQFYGFGCLENVTDVEIHFFDSTGAVYLLTPDNSSFHGIKIYFLSSRRIVIAYELHEEEGIHYCSWGYKTSSPDNEKIFIYFKTGTSAYLAYADAEFPERQFFLTDDDSEGYNTIQNLHRFLQEYLRKDCIAHENLP